MRSGQGGAQALTWKLCWCANHRFPESTEVFTFGTGKCHGRITRHSCKARIRAARARSAVLGSNTLPVCRPHGSAKGHDGSVFRCYDAVVRTTIDISDEAYYLAKAIARDQNRSLGRVVGDLILQSSKAAKGATINMSDYGFPTFRCSRPVTSEDVKALDDEE